MNISLRKIFLLRLTTGLTNPRLQNFGVGSTRKAGKSNHAIETDDDDVSLDNLKDEMEEYYTEKFEGIKTSQESILKTYERQMKMARENLEQQQARLKNEKFEKAAQEHFTDIPVKEFMKRSKDLTDSIRLNTAWSPYHKKDAYQNTFDYEKFKGNEINLKDYKHDPEDIGEFSKGQAIENFVSSLTKEDQATRVARDEAETDSSEDLDYRDWNTEDFLPGDINEGGFDPIPPLKGARLSPWAREELYRLHLEGWTVRDLSLRFGILPERVKAIIYLKQLFYDDYLPKMSLEHLKVAFEWDLEEGGPFVDYGIDLELMANDEQGIELIRFRSKPEDLDPSPEVKDRMVKIHVNKQKNKWERVTEGFEGKGNRGYLLKSLHVNQGHGSERVNNKFKMIIRHSDKPQLLPLKARRALEKGKGPRLASLGFGVK